MEKKRIAIFGAGGFGIEVAMLIEQINQLNNCWNLIGFFDDERTKGHLVNGYPVLGGIRELNSWNRNLNIAIALGMPSAKKKVFHLINNDLVSFPTLIHPNVVMGRSDLVRIGNGCIICAGNILTTNIEICDHVILNLACTVGHNVSIGRFSAFMPSCNISGDVIIGDSNFWGTGSKVINRKKIGSGVVIGAGAVVTTDIPDYVTAVGVPAKVIKVNGEGRWPERDRSVVK